MKENYKQPIFVTELIDKLTVPELFDLMRTFNISYISYNEAGDGSITYGMVVKNRHFEGSEKEAKIFLSGLLISQWQ